MTRRRLILIILGVPVLCGIPTSGRTQTRVAPFVAAASDGVDRAPDPASFHDAINGALELVPALLVTWPAAEGASAIAECGGDAQCLGDVVRRAGATLGLAVALFASGGKQLISLRLVNEDGRYEEPIVVEAKSESEAKQAIHKAILRAAENVRHEILGRVVVDVTPSGANLLVDHRPPKATTTPGGSAIVLRPGPHLFEATAVDFDPTQTVVDVQAGETIDLRLALTPAAPPWTARPVTWIVVGGAVVATVAIVLAVALRGPDSLTVCHGPRDSPCP